MPGFPIKSITFFKKIAFYCFIVKILSSSKSIWTHFYRTRIVHLKTVMYQSIPNLNIPPPPPPLRANPRWIFWKGEFPTPGTKKVRNLDPWVRKIMLKLHPQGNYFQKFSKEQNIEIMKNSTEIRICSEILKQWNKTPKPLCGWLLLIFKISQVFLHSSIN